MVGIPLKVLELMQLFTGAAVSPTPRLRRVVAVVRSRLLLLLLLVVLVLLGLPHGDTEGLFLPYGLSVSQHDCICRVVQNAARDAAAAAASGRGSDIGVVAVIVVVVVQDGRKGSVVVGRLLPHVEARLVGRTDKVKRGSFVRAKLFQWSKNYSKHNLKNINV